jgi:hypothetical protein
MADDSPLGVRHVWFCPNTTVRFGGLDPKLPSGSGVHGPKLPSGSGVHGPKLPSGSGLPELKLLSGSGLPDRTPLWCSSMVSSSSLLSLATPEALQG